MWREWEESRFPLKSSVATLVALPPRTGDDPAVTIFAEAKPSIRFAERNSADTGIIETPLEQSPCRQ